MTGLVMCGGQSIRMGTDKGLLKLHANTWAQTAVEKLTTLGLEVILSVNEQQFEDYASIFPADKLIVDNKQLNIKGPVCGVLSAHVLYPGEDLFILACDMPLMESALLKELQHHQNSTNASAIVFVNEGEPEPLCGIYRSSGLAGILQMLRNGELTKHSMKFMLDHLNTQLIPVPDDMKQCFRNFNAHAQLNGL